MRRHGAAIISHTKRLLAAMGVILAAAFIALGAGVTIAAAQSEPEPGQLTLNAFSIGGSVSVDVTAELPGYSTGDLWVSIDQEGADCPSTSAELSGAGRGFWLAGGDGSGEWFQTEYSGSWTYRPAKVPRNVGVWRVCALLTWDDPSGGGQQTLVEESAYAITRPCPGVVQGIVGSWSSGEFVRLNRLSAAEAGCAYARSQARRVLRNYRTAVRGPEFSSDCDENGYCQYVYGPSRLPGPGKRDAFFKRFGFDIGVIQTESDDDWRTVEMDVYHEPAPVYAASCGRALTSRTCS